MKKVLALLILFAVIGGYNFFHSKEEKNALTIAQNKRMKTADIFANNRWCSSLQKDMEQTLQKGESIRAIFYSQKEQACLYEKQIQKKENFEIVLINFLTKKQLASWSSESGNYQDYTDIMSLYQK